MLTRLIPLFALAIMAMALPAQACDIRFSQQTYTINLPSGGPERSVPAFERLPLQIRNRGDAECSFRIGITREGVESVAAFPQTQVSTPFGPIYLTDLLPVTSGSSAENVSRHTLGPGEQLTIVYRFAARTDWTTEADTYHEELIFTAFEDESDVELDSARAQVNLSVQPATNIQFVGNVRRLDLGKLSRDTVTRSPPFAIRVFSTTPYKLSVTSGNNGYLRHLSGDARIPYRMTLDGSELDLGGGGDELFYTEPTGNLGRVLPVRVTVGPQRDTPAGKYQDLVTVTITTI